jgi:hypothetical protein
MKWTPNDQQREILEALQHESTRDGNATDFIKTFGIFSYPKFSRILNAIDPKADRSYFDDIKDKAGLMNDLAEWLEKLPRLRLEHERANVMPLYKLSTFRAVAQSIRDCKDKATPERITKYISPTGGSKTMLRRFLTREFKSEIAFSHIECRESWKPMNRDDRKRANLAALKEICAGLGVRLGSEVPEGGINAIEDELVRFCAAVKRLLFLDEAEFFSKYTLNLLKTLLNETQLVIVIACTPRAHTKWNTYYPDEADQIARRTHATVQVSSLREEDVALFFPDDQFQDEAWALGYIATEASRFGHYSLVARVAEKLKCTNRAEQKEVEKAVNGGLVQMHRNGAQWDGNRPDEVTRLKAA